jgi:Ca2+-dependent lipid-binding protein
MAEPNIPDQGNKIADESNQLKPALNNELITGSSAPAVNDNKASTSAEIPQITVSEEPSTKSTKTDKPTAKLTEQDKPTSKKAEVSTTPYFHDTLGKNGLPVWYNVGWTGFSSLPNPGDDAAMQEFASTHTAEEILDIFTDYGRSSPGDYSSDLVAQFIPDKFLGEWYYNCGAVFLAILLTWILLKCHLGLTPCLAVGSIFGRVTRHENK